jgi:hypothetical protein
MKTLLAVLHDPVWWIRLYAKSAWFKLTYWTALLLFAVAQGCAFAHGSLLKTGKSVMDYRAKQLSILAKQMGIENA